MRTTIGPSATAVSTQTGPSTELASTFRCPTEMCCVAQTPLTDVHGSDTKQGLQAVVSPWPTTSRLSAAYLLPSKSILHHPRSIGCFTYSGLLSLHLVWRKLMCE